MRAPRHRSSSCGAATALSGGPGGAVAGRMVGAARRVWRDALARAVAVLGAGLAGCAVVPPGDPAQDARLKTFTPPAGLVGLYVVRSDATAPAVRMDVDIDGMPLGQTGARTFLYRTVAPGRHTVTAHAENTAALDLEVAAGTLAFVHQEPTWGMWQARTRLRVLDEAAGRQAVLGSRLAPSLAPTQRIDVAVQADDPAWDGPLDCEASNPFGRWPFRAPGAVTVAIARAPLQIACAAPAGAVAQVTTPAPPTAAEGQRARAGAGAAAGAGLGLVLGAAAAPVAGPAMVVLLTLGGAMRGVEAGGAVAAASAGGAPAYPDAIVVRIRQVPSAGPD